ncbi:methyl jasmonate esterase 1-like isoform X2 [Alnus glutinosa]|uniref:methyl jasmonate esterase 1-like isoform X2 n=1 Tax=Alnus glutinosa TaxID=3517 RepID=UPI002D7786E9|nr:methyl jasmonate esterase 1-like isoform X2 [Alnus glutinosa]
MVNSKHFVLVHGICHGAWCWYKVATLLKSAGHRVTALDLGSSGVDPRRLDEVYSISDSLQPLMDSIASLPHDERVILVGHSYGGMGISLAMESFPDKILVAVFVTAFMPNIIFPPATLVQEDLELAKMLVKPSKLFLQDLAMESLLTEEKFGSVSRVYIVCDKDELLKEDFQRWMIEKSPPKEVKSIAGADHMIMLSKPNELCLSLQQIAEKY